MMLAVCDPSTTSASTSRLPPRAVRTASSSSGRKSAMPSPSSIARKPAPTAAGAPASALWTCSAMIRAEYHRAIAAACSSACRDVSDRSSGHRIVRMFMAPLLKATRVPRDRVGISAKVSVFRERGSLEVRIIPRDAALFRRLESKMTLSSLRVEAREQPSHEHGQTNEADDDSHRQHHDRHAEAQPHHHEHEPHDDERGVFHQPDDAPKPECV